MKKTMICLLVLVFAIVIVSFVFQVYGGNSAVVEANILIPEISSPNVSIIVPDYLFLGDVNVGEMSNEIGLDINNSGSVNVTITPLLADSSEEIYKNLYFRQQKTSGGKAVPFTRIGDFKLSMKKSYYNRHRKETIYMMLNLTDFSGEIDEELIGYKSNVTFIAVADI